MEADWSLLARGYEPEGAYNIEVVPLGGSPYSLGGSIEDPVRAVYLVDEPPGRVRLHHSAYDGAFVDLIVVDLPPVDPPVVDFGDPRSVRAERGGPCGKGYPTRLAYVPLEIRPSTEPGWIVEILDPDTGMLDWVDAAGPESARATVHLGPDRKGTLCMVARIRDPANELWSEQDLPCAKVGGCVSGRARPTGLWVLFSALLLGLRRSDPSVAVWARGSDPSTL